jgi:hypothetical protein
MARNDTGDRSDQPTAPPPDHGTYDPCPDSCPAHPDDGQQAAATAPSPPVGSGS